MLEELGPLADIVSLASTSDQNARRPVGAFLHRRPASSKNETDRSTTDSGTVRSAFIWRGSVISRPSFSYVVAAIQRAWTLRPGGLADPISVNPHRPTIDRNLHPACPLQEQRRLRRSRSTAVSLRARRRWYEAYRLLANIHGKMPAMWIGSVR